MRGASPGLVCLGTSFAFMSERALPSEAGVAINGARGSLAEALCKDSEALVYRLAFAHGIRSSRGFRPERMATGVVKIMA